VKTMSGEPSGDGVRIPGHVPPHLVRTWDYEAAAGAERDIHAANAVLAQGPEIIYSAITIAATEPGGWLVTRNRLVREVLQDPETFSSLHLTGWSKLLGESWQLIPLEVDGEDHRLYRTLMNPLFSPKRMAGLEAGMRQSAVELIEGCLANGECDFETEFGHPFPVYVFLRLMGLPLGMMRLFLEWEHGLLHGKVKEKRAAAAQAIKDYLLEAIAERRKDPKDDLISFAITSQVDGRPLTDAETLGICFVLFAAGLDTVASALGFIFKHLAEHPEDQRRLRREPAAIPAAVEEMLRAYAVVTTTRRVTRDIEFHGVTMREGDRIILPMTITARDGEEYDNPNKVDFDRENVRHITFGAGPHRCIGSHLARIEIRIALEEWLSRVPEFGIPEGKRAIVQANGVWGLTSLPLDWPGA
jgi:cytochrome P450